MSLVYWLRRGDGGDSAGAVYAMVMQARADGAICCVRTKRRGTRSGTSECGEVRWHAAISLKVPHGRHRWLWNLRTKTC